MRGSRLAKELGGGHLVHGLAEWLREDVCSALLCGDLDKGACTLRDALLGVVVIERDVLHFSCAAVCDIRIAPVLSS